MYKIRPVQTSDIDDLYQLAVKMAPGITTFPPDKSVLQCKIEQSIIAFEMAIEQTVNRQFLLVLEDLSTSKVIGTAGVYNNIGTENPFYSFKIIKQTQINKDYSLKTCSSTLHLTNAFQGGTEVGTLLLDPEYNGMGLGKFLAKSRYLLIANFMTLFNEPVFAELRGWSNKTNESPFWEAVGRHFFAGLDFDKADLYSAISDNQFIADMMPKYPIYVDLLPKAAQRAIGRANRKGQAALTMLQQEGFRDEGYVDIFDAGATVVANFFDIETIHNSQTYTMHTKTPESLQESDSSLYIATRGLDDFSVTMHNKYKIVDDELFIDTNEASHLGLINHQTVRAYSLT